MYKNQEDNIDSKIISRLYLGIFILFLILITMFLYISTLIVNDSKYNIKYLNFNIQSEIKNGLNILKNELVLRSDLIKFSKDYSFVSLDDESSKEMFKAFYVLNPNSELIYSKEFANSNKIINFNLSWFDNFKKNNFQNSKFIFKNDNNSTLYVAYSNSSQYKIVAEVNLNFLFSKIENALSQSDERSIIIDKNANFIYGHLDENILSDSFIFKLIDLEDDFKNDTKLTYSVNDFRFYYVAYLDNLDIFIITYPFSRNTMIIQIILLVSAVFLFFYFMLNFRQNILYIKNNFIFPIISINNFLKNYCEDKNINLGEIKEFKLIESSIRDLYKKIGKSDEDLQHYKNRFGYIFEQSPLVLLVYDAYSGKIIDASKKAVDFYGYDYHELVNLNIKDICVSSYSETFLRSQFPKQNYDYKHILKNGQYKFVNVISADINLKDTSFILLNISDTTIGENIRKSDENIKKFMIDSPSILMVADEKNPFLIEQCTLNISALFDIEQSEVLLNGFNICNFIVDYDKQNFISQIQNNKLLFKSKNSQGKESFQLFLNLKTQNNSQHLFKVFVKFVENEEQNLEKIVYIFSNYDDLKNIQNNHKIEIDNYKNMLKDMSYTAWEWDSNSDTLRTNDDFANLLGYSNISELGNLNFNKMKEIFADKFDSFREFFSQIQINEDTYFSEIKFYKKNREIIWLRLHARTLEFDANSRASVIRGVFKKIEKSVVSYENLSSILFSHSQDPIAILDLNGNFIDVNDSFCYINDCAYENVLGENLSKFIDEKEEIFNVINSNSAYQGRVGNKFITLMPLKNNQKENYFYIMIILNI